MSTQAIARDRLVRYLTTTGWVPPAGEGPAGGLWRHPNSHFTLPVPRDLSTDGLDWQQILHRIAQVEGSEVADVAARLDGRLVDIANLRAANDIVIHDTIPYPAGVVLVREGWTMLRSAATTSLGPRSHIRRFGKTADEIVAAARMAHTRRGSFIIPIHLPLPEPEVPAKDDILPGADFTVVPESRERRVMRTFAESLAALDTVAVQPEREPGGDRIHDLIRAGVSHEFGAALHRILDQEAVSEFGASFVWASSAGPAPATPDTVAIPAAANDRIKRVAVRLKTEVASRSREYLTGPIVGVRRDDQDQAGVVTVQVSRNARLAHVNVNVSRERLNEALDWMKARSTVVVDSLVHRTSAGLLADSRDAVNLMTSYQLP
jgi:hypothetical protein